MTNARVRPGVRFTVSNQMNYSDKALNLPSQYLHVATVEA